MQGGDLRDAIHVVGMSEGEFGRCIGATRETVSRWICGKMPVPGAVATLAHLLVMTKERAPAADVAGLLRRASARDAEMETPPLA